VSLQSRLASFITAVGADIKALQYNQAGMERRGTTDWTNSTTTPTDIFTGFTPAAQTTYLVEAFLMGNTAATTTALQVALVGPTTGIGSVAIKYQLPATTNTEFLSFIAGMSNFPGNTTAPAAFALYKVEGVFITTTPGVGNVRFQGQSEIGGSLVTVRIGSFMRWTAITTHA
jgi:hypothetical protein